MTQNPAIQAVMDLIVGDDPPMPLINFGKNPRVVTSRDRDMFVVGYSAARLLIYPHAKVICAALKAADDPEDEKLRQVLKACAKTFRHYEQLHAAKPDMVKSEANGLMAQMCEDALK